MGYILSAIVLISVVFCLSMFLHVSLCSPLAINTVAWSIPFISGLVFHRSFYSLNETVIFLWLIWFTVTTVIFLLSSSFCLCEKSTYGKNQIRRLPIDYFFILIVLIVWLGYKIWVVGNTGPAHFSLNLRLAAVGIEGFPSIGIVEQCYPLVFALFLFEHVYEHQQNRHLRFLLWFWMLLYAVATMGKLSLLTPIMSWVIIKGTKGKLEIRKTIMLAPILFILMMTIHFMRAGTADTSSLGDVLSTYTYAPLVGLGYVGTDDSLPTGAYSLRFFYAVGYRLGITQLKPVNTISAFIEVPTPVNTFTAIYPFYVDFGVTGVLLGALFYGLFFSFLYLLSIKGKGLALTLYSGFSIAILLQFFGEVLIMNLSLNLRIFIWLVLIHLVSRRVNYVC